MAGCPNCGTRLDKRRTESGIVYVCAGCGGRAAGLAVLRKAGAAPEFVRDLWRRSRAMGALKVRTCPHCERRMAQTTSASAIQGRPVSLDVCLSCASVWFDASEFESLPRKRAEALPRVLPDRAREQAALLKVESLRKQRDEGYFGGPDETWQWLPGILGLPVEIGAPKLSRLPWLTWAIAALAILATLPTFWMASHPVLTEDGTYLTNQAVQEWGFIPAEWYRHGGLTFITSFFLHGGFFHILSNLYFLLVFGDNVEDHLGRRKYILLIGLAHVVGILAHGLFDPRSDIPCVGASAGISGIIAYYAIAFPRVRIGILFRYFLYFRWLRIPASVALGLFVALQILGAAFQVKGFSNVSYLAHIGGLVIGMGAGAGMYMARSRSRTVALRHVGKIGR